MKTISIQDFRSHPKAAKELLAVRQEALLTAGGKPVAVLVPVSAETLDDTVRAVRMARGQMTLQTIRQHARETGRSQMTLTEIDAVIAKTRAARRRRARAAAR
jgi:antitoxin (DNA-binding transcriptional repressor) of toxin-antitoxin stability system